MAVSEAVAGVWTGISSEVGGLKSDRVRAVLEKQILSGQLPPGTLLPREPVLGEALGVSRTVLRDAVRALVAQGLLTVRQGRGTEVAEPSDEAFATAAVTLLARSGLSVGDVMQARTTIEVMLVRLAAENGTEEDWDALARSEAALIAAIQAGDDAGAHAAHGSFHAGILRATHQPALDLMLKPIGQIALVTGSTSVRPGAMEDWDLDAHRAILDALRSGDADAAERAMRKHFDDLSGKALFRELLDRRFSEAYFVDAESTRH